MDCEWDAYMGRSTLVGISGSSERAVPSPLNVEHELTRQRKWDKQETQEYMRHFNALKLDKLTSDPR